MSSQTALRLPQRGSWIRLTKSEEPRPHAGKHEVLIKIRSVALNFRDIAIATGLYPLPVKDNVVPGSDAAGDVVEIGEGVSSGLEKGDEVVIAFDPASLYRPIKSWATGLGGPVDGVLREYISAVSGGGEDSGCVLSELCAVGECRLHWRYGLELFVWCYSYPPRTNCSFPR